MAKKYGNQTPTRSHILPYKKSYGDRAIERYELSGRKAMPWQKLITKDILAVELENGDEVYVHSDFGYSVPRQNGKNEILTIIENDSLHEGLRVLHTAHRADTSHKAFERLKDVLDEIGYIEKEDYTQIKAFGKEEIRLAKSGGIIEFRTRTTTGGLGSTYDLLIIDEAQEYTADQQSALMYTISSTPNPQTIYTGTPNTGYSSGSVFSKMRNNAELRRRTGWHEWGVEEESNVNDKDLWYLTNPSLGHLLRERTIETELNADNEMDFNIQRLGLWIQYNLASAITEEEWGALKINDVPGFDQKLHVGIKYGYDNQNVALSVAVETEDGHIFVEAIDCVPAHYGNAWLVDFLAFADVEQVVVDGASGQDILEKDLKQARVKAKYVKPTTSQFINANSEFMQGIHSKSIQHLDQPSLTAIATNNLTRKIGSKGGFGFNAMYEEHEVALLDSIILAYWSCKKHQEKPISKKVAKIIR